MELLTLAEIDAELAQRGRELDKISATLLELDEHPGLVLLRGYPPAGVTATRWEPMRSALEGLWEDFGRVRTILDRARAIRAGKHRLSDAERAEVTGLLRDRAFEVARDPIPMSQRSLTGPAEKVRYVGLADTLDRMRAAYPRLAEFLDEVDAINSRVLSGLSPVQAQLDRLAGSSERAAGILADVADLLGLSATDPLSLTLPEIDTRIAALRARVTREADALAEALALASDWPAAIAETRSALDELGRLRERAAELRVEAETKIHTVPLPVRVDETPGLAAELSALALGSSGAPPQSGIGRTDPTVVHTFSVADIPAPPAGPGAPVRPSAPVRDATALLALRRRIAAAAAMLGGDLDLAQGLLDRRAELRGRLAAYEAKSARIGVGEDPDVLASSRVARDLLAHRPCDLAAATRAILDYQQAVARAAGRGA
ncbi:hypothetical protein [Nocardia stercoris]|uniref:Uncharacterized protein n=1 Tax=Nocardia stercoris TaxID=2483361 RepID=A0A3M2KYH4_9NOCA|nr:hypothetical protein [Nocardia stercoris]RMI29686.1 hypothetical protein EBN03_25155 [Nocardia stercoris]